MRNFFIISKLFGIIILFVFMRDFSRLFPAYFPPISRFHSGSIPLASHFRSACISLRSHFHPASVSLGVFMGRQRQFAPGVIFVGVIFFDFMPLSKILAAAGGSQTRPYKKNCSRGARGTIPDCHYFSRTPGTIVTDCSQEAIFFPDCCGSIACLY
jgi:hypothetical protein